jgi:hypothetical protein
MKRLKSPQLKKQDEYDKDHRPHMENPHAFRKNWPKKKARVHRRERAAVRSLFAGVEIGEVTTEVVKNVRRTLPKIVKSGVVPLRQRIKDNREKSEKRTTPAMTKRPDVS